jgi:hypothetical protein
VASTVDDSEKESDDDDTVIGMGRGKKKDLWPMTLNVHGHPILPAFNKEDHYPSLGDLKSILRSFVTYSYRMFLFISRSSYLHL